MIVRDLGIGKISATSESGIPDEVSLNFEEIFGVLQKRGAEAEQSLQTIEECLANVIDQLDKTQKQFESATAQEKSLDAQAGRRPLLRRAQLLFCIAARGTSQLEKRR